MPGTDVLALWASDILKGFTDQGRLRASVSGAMLYLTTFANPSTCAAVNGSQVQLGPQADYTQPKDS